MKYLSAILPLMAMCSAGHAAVIFNKEGSKVDFYGKISPRHYFSDQSSQDGDKTFVRIGLRGETKVSDRLTGYSRWEMEFKGNNPEVTSKGDKIRYGYAGLRDTQIGSIDYGRNLGVLYDIGSWTDMLPEFGSDTWSQNDVYMAKRTTGVLTLRSADFFRQIEGLDVAVQYQGKNDQGRDDLRRQNGDGAGVSVIYKWRDISSGLTWAQSNRTSAQKNSRQSLNASGAYAQAWGTGFKYDDGKFYAATVYASTFNMTAFGNYIANKTVNVESVLQYQFSNGFRPSIGYLRSKGYDISGYGNKMLVEYISIGGFYYFNKNFSSVLDYRVNLLNAGDFTKKTGINTDNILAVGFTYAF